MRVLRKNPEPRPGMPGARTRATAHERTPQQERQKAAREAERGREAWTLGVMSRDVVESVEGYAANRRVVSVVVVEVEPAGQRQASFGL